MSVTLSIPPAIVQEIRLWADANETSLNQFVRDCLEAKVNEIQAARRRKAKEFFAYCNDNLVETPKGWRYDRERDGVRAV